MAVDGSLAVGKIPTALLQQMLEQAPVHDPDVRVGPGVGFDCAVVEHGDHLLVFKSDPITFATEELGWYLVQVNANDVATTGAQPRWFLVTLLLPEGQSNQALFEALSAQIYAACEQLNIAVIGGHTEVTYGLSRPIAVGTLVGEVSRDRLVTPLGVSPGDRILLTKGVPIEGTAILAREFPDRLSEILSEEELRLAADYLYSPGISVLRDAQVAMDAGQVTAMHDPTEGGLVAALWELAQATNYSFVVDFGAVPVPDLAARLCNELALDPFSTIASGALLITVARDDASAVQRALQDEGIRCADIGEVLPGSPGVWRLEDGDRHVVPRPARDEIARLFEIS